MAQAQLGTYGVDGAAGEVLQRLRDGDCVCWVPDGERPVVIEYDPRPDAGDADTDVDPQPWQAFSLESDWMARLTRAAVLERLDDAGVDEPSPAFEVLRQPTRCAGCSTPLPPGWTVESQHEWVRDVFCSGRCLHDCEAALEVELTPTREHTPETAPVVHAAWNQQGRDRADAHLPRWSA